MKPGETARLTIKPAPTPVTVTANEAAEVWLDGSRIGDAPVNEMPVPLGTHEIIVKRAAGGERKMTVTVTTKPMTLNVRFHKAALRLSEPPDLSTTEDTEDAEESMYFSPCPPVSSVVES